MTEIEAYASGINIPAGKETFTMFVIKSGVIYEVTDGDEKEFVSPFAEEIFQQDTQSWGHEAWKFKDNEGDLEKGLVPRSMLWGGGGKIKQPVRVKANY